MNERKNRILQLSAVLIAAGVVAFVWSIARGHPDAAWRTYMVNFLLFSGIAQGALVFSAMMNTVQAKWSGRLAGLAESFAAFFPVSFVLFLGLIAGWAYVFPWVHHDLHGKEVWLNLPFLFSRDGIALLVLYGLGFAYLYYSLWFKVNSDSPQPGLQKWLVGLWGRRNPDREKYAHRRYVFGVLYLLAFAAVLSLIGFDLVMAAEPHWYSTLFGAYTFIKSVYAGFGALIILAAYLHVNRGIAFSLSSSEFIDMGKLYLAFCLAWADFFYCQLVVIWYGNIPEETAYVIARTMLAPWNRVAWAVFIVCFIVPFMILINRKIKTVPWFMSLLCGVVLVGMWFEHYLLLGPALGGHNGAISLSAADLLISLGFAGLLIFMVTVYLRQFPGIVETAAQKADSGRQA
ncbi:MAG: hypothetical protein K9K81_10410 [Desulfobacteraceae bacterium]|nr:hypothetical protein [Desulfobacteraceae bacterium]